APHAAAPPGAPRVAATRAAVSADRRARAVLGDAEAGGARRVSRRARLHQRRPHPERRLLLVADDREGDRAENRDRRAPLYRARSRPHLAAGGAAGAREVGPAS